MDISQNGIFQYHNTAFRVHPSFNSNEDDIKSHSLSNSPNLKRENSSSTLNENETYRTIVSMLINQRKTNLSLEQQLKHLQSTTNHINKATTSQSPILPTYSNSSIELNSNQNLINDNYDRLNLNQSFTIKPFSFDEHQQRNFIFHNSQNHFITHSIASSSSSSSSNSTGYSSGSSSSSSSLDSNSTILSAYSSRSNSSLSERSKTSPTPLKQIPLQYLPTINETNMNFPTTTTDDEVTQLTSLNENKYKLNILSQQSPLPSTSEQLDTINNKPLTKRRKTITLEGLQRPTTRSQSISERVGGNSCTSISTESCPIVTRKRKASIVMEQNESEIKRTTIDYIKQLDEMKIQYIKANSNRQTNCSTYSNGQTINKSQLASRLKVIDFLKDHLYPTDSAILSFQLENQELFPKRRLLNQRIREIRQKLMSNLNQQQLLREPSS
ncbi:unnamed protein product [Rotaria sp. Silwood2]|nr:unnamed protein product [Rotaria sp. Silwood2]